MGRRLGYDVSNGLYRGRKNEVGFDGLWKSQDGTYIIMESKTSDDYSISIESVIGYRDKLLIENKVSRKKCSILIVYGRDDKNALRNIVKGSDDAKSIRLISANALFQMVKIVSASSSDTTRKQVISMLQPRDYFVLDNLVELVFPQTDADIPEIDDNDDDESLNSSNTEQHSFSSKTVGNTKYPPLPDPNMKAGNFIKTAMTNLANSGFEFTDEQIVELCKEESMHTVVGLSRHLPFFKHFDPEDSKGHLIDGRPRFYSKPLTFGKHTVYLNSQLYDGDKEPFISWYEALTN